MSDDMSSDKKTQSGPTIFYAKNTKKEEKSKLRGKGGFSDYKSKSKPRTERNSRYGKDESDNRIETFKPRHKSNDGDKASSSPWKNRFKVTEQQPSFDVEQAEANSVDAERMRKQRKEETFVYSENSCKAIFANRPESIVKAFLLQEKTYEFKALVAWLVEHRLGYDVISDEQMTKITQTPHHGGVCLIVKKRQPVLVNDYLLTVNKSEKDCVLAIDDINNPHNLGGIARTAAFFGVNGLLLRQPDLLENGASLRVAEGGAEYITPIKADDLITSIDLFKNNGYQIIALLPFKDSAIKAEQLAKITVKAKTVLVIFQQVNPKLAELADKVVYLSGSEVMPALNISVLTGILLAKWQEKQRN